MINKNNLKKWKQFLEKFESVEFPLKKYLSLIKPKLINIKPRINIFKFEFKDQGFFNFYLQINYENISNNSYYGETDIYDILKKNFKDFTIKINIQDDKIKENILLSVIQHELKHVLDLSNVKDPSESSFLKDVNKNKLRNIGNKIYQDEFYNLVYLSLKHELEARNSMIYELLRWLKNYDDLEIKNEFKNTYIYKSLIKLKNFNSKLFINKFDKNQLLSYTELFLQAYGDRDTKIDITIKKLNIENYYNQWENYFHKVSDEYLKKTNEVLQELINDNKPYMENRWISSNGNEEKIIETFKNKLIHINKKFISF